MTCDRWNDGLFGFLAHKELPDIDHGGVAIHLRHVEIHQNEIISALSIMTLLEVILDHLESLLPRESRAAVQLGIEADAVVKNYF